MNEIEKCFDAAMDLVRWLDHRITQKIEHQLEQRLAQEREYWRCTVSDLIAEERERVNALLRDTHKDIFDLTRERNEELFNRVDQIRKQSDDRLLIGSRPRWACAVPMVMARRRRRSTNAK